jgi:hypothetical protein
MLVYKITNNHNNAILYNKELNVVEIGKYIDIFGTAEIGDVFNIELVEKDEDYLDSLITLNETEEYKEWAGRYK